MSEWTSLDHKNINMEMVCSVLMDLLNKDIKSNLFLKLSNIFKLENTSVHIRMNFF